MMIQPIKVIDGLLSPRTRASLTEAMQHIAPAWPLDQMIAVNPYWELRDQPFREVSARWAALAGIRCLLSQREYWALFKEGKISLTARDQAAQLQDLHPNQLLPPDAVDAPAHPLARWHNLSELIDANRSPSRMSWKDEIIHQISQFCGRYYQDLTTTPNTRKHRRSLYKAWLTVVQKDHGLSIVMSEPGLRQCFESLPVDAESLITTAMTELDVDDDTLKDYAEALLLDINGWAAYVAYKRWQARLSDSPHFEMLDLLAIRLAWELVIWRHVKQGGHAHFKLLQQHWDHEKASFHRKLAAHRNEQRVLWAWAHALELSDQHLLQHRLVTTQPAPPEPVSLQAVFCIDVRSEIMRRALESQDPGIQTYGFAGFFGLPISYEPHGTTLRRPQLPGLLHPPITVTEVNMDDQRTDTLNLKARWQDWSQSSGASFSMVETVGWWYAFKLLRQSLFPEHHPHPVNALSHRSHWQLRQNGVLLTTSEKTALARSALKTIGIIDFAPKVLLVGHGSVSANNLHASSLDCGACGGQSGEVNVRVLAQLLNDSDIRSALVSSELNIPETTVFIPALHNTTTDEISCLASLPDPELERWLKLARHRTQEARAGRLDPALQRMSDEARDQAFQFRARDASQVRPEWGLADNSSFIIAPRSWTRMIDLDGRSFLHDYNWQTDDDASLLTLLMTAPMIVTNWINMQYNASVTDNHKLGSGNKVLHNAVGGSIGVFEGHGGDLRIGLSRQSLHNGQQWMHTPRRLSVYVAAPRKAIAAIVERHDDVRHLINNDWLYLFRWDQAEGIERLYQGRWRSTAT